ncbi:rifin [Plasmodium falciparum NF54]|uniref:Rifin n=2 Tax=Plasmodium falciparum TaxID=5833 RepID=O97326_PLAF7|nr:rifin [Plasmodium falciparum 3D7]KAF4328840.1 rifin [Plasmodium falciparum NF54]PKC45405.1 rifin [Plasmodium falciparum NF54]CAB39118.1 rifin [Plasmodium falciparum 3D7]|eukprot:XP_001351083.1 rifin [Plasmodium falciparum 3D7]
MKLLYSNILLFALALNILLTSYYAHNKNKPSITPHHTRTTTSRLLSECDTESSIYDSDEEINSVKEIFERQTSRRFEEYEERMITQRQKYKEQRDKDIQKIIHKDKMEKNLAEKIEKGCLRCGCGLGSVAGSIGLFGAVAINIWKPAALDAAIAKAITEGTANISAAGVKAGEATGKVLVISGLKKMGISTLGGKNLESYFATTSYKKVASIAQAVYEQHFEKCEFGYLKEGFTPVGDPSRDIHFCQSVWQQTSVVSKTGHYISPKDVIKRTVETMVSKAEGPANAAAEFVKATETATIKAAEEKTIETASTQLYSAIGYSILAILIIVLIMLIIYLILRYRRKKKMKKKAQYTKLLNE